jgi:SAM-dependent methyltransferase
MLRKQDAYGQLVWDFFKKGRGQEIVERDDGLLDPSDILPAYYFSTFDDWDKYEREAMRFVRGKVLDVGCGAGRVALYLQKKGFDVVGIDSSPLAVRVCRLRGLKKVRVLRADKVGVMREKFDTILMFCNNFGICGSYKRARHMLRDFFDATTDDSRIIAGSLDPYGTKDPAHLAYQKQNRRRGRMPGQVRIRVRYRTYMTPWFDLLLVSGNEMRRLVAGTGWHVEHFIDSKRGPYIGVIGKTRSQN